MVQFRQLDYGVSAPRAKARRLEEVATPAGAVQDGLRRLLSTHGCVDRVDVVLEHLRTLVDLVGLVDEREQLFDRIPVPVGPGQQQ